MPSLPVRPRLRRPWRAAATLALLALAPQLPLGAQSAARPSARQPLGWDPPLEGRLASTRRGAPATVLLWVRDSRLLGAPATGEARVRPQWSWPLLTPVAVSGQPAWRTWQLPLTTWDVDGYGIARLSLDGSPQDSVVVLHPALRAVLTGSLEARRCALGLPRQMPAWGPDPYPTTQEDVVAMLRRPTIDSLRRLWPVDRYQVVVTDDLDPHQVAAFSSGPPDTVFFRPRGDTGHGPRVGWLHAFVHELTHGAAAGAPQQGFRGTLPDSIPPVTDPSVYGYEARAEQEAEAMAWAWMILRHAQAAPQIAPWAEWLEWQEARVPGTMYAMHRLLGTGGWAHHPWQGRLAQLDAALVTARHAAHGSCSAPRS